MNQPGLASDVYRFDPSWGVFPGDTSAVAASYSRQDPSLVGVRQVVFTARFRRILATHVLHTTVSGLLSQPSRLAEPTAYFVTQHLIRIYIHLFRQAPPPCEAVSGAQTHLRWMPDPQGQLHPVLDLDTRPLQDYVRKTIVDNAIQDSNVLEKLVDQALDSACAWFFKSLETRLGLEALTELPDGELGSVFQSFLDEHHGTTEDRLTYLIHLCAQNLARGLIETLDPLLRTASLGQIEQMLGLTTPAARTAPAVHPLHEFLEVMSASHYHAVREALAHKRFNHTEDSPWPTAVLNKGPARGYAELRPAAMDMQAFIPPDEEKQWVERMWKQREELSDLDADALDALSSIWLRQAKYPEQDAIAGVDELLEMRGIQPKKAGNGRRGGYRAEQRTEMLCALSHIQNIWMNMTQMDIYDEPASGQRKGRAQTMAIKSRAFTITDMMGQLRLDGHMDVSRFIFRPGKVFANFLFGIGRQTALLSAQALRYDPYRQSGEKRLTRYLSWQWRCQAGGGCGPKIYRVDTLLEVTGDTPNERYPNRTRDRLEKLLDTLHQDKVISAWQYERWHEDSAAQRGWLGVWLESTLLLEPPPEVRDHYNGLVRIESAPKLRLAPKAPLGELVRQRRLKQGLSQSQLGALLGLHQSAVNRLERGHRAGSTATRERVEAWLSS